MKAKQALFTSNSNEWETPLSLFDELNKQFNFTLDPASTSENALCDNFYTKEDNGLVQSWENETVYCNPPYGREITEWAKKACKESKKGTNIVMLIPARTDTIYWHEYVFNKANIYFFKGRLKFSGSKTSAPFPSAIACYNCKLKRLENYEFVSLEL